MKIKNLTLSMALVAMVFTSCNKDGQVEVPVIDEKRLELRLNSGITEQRTRGSFETDTQIANGESVIVYVDDKDGNQTIGNRVLIADGNGGLNGEKIMVDQENKFSVYAFNVDRVSSDNNFPVAVTHPVSLDQSIAANYATSDLLYAAARNVSSTKNAIGLTFYHMFSKVEVALKAGQVELDLSGAEVYIVGTKTKADFKPSKTVNLSIEEERASMISVTPTDNEATDIKIGNDVTSNDNWGKNYTYNEAVIVPQELTQGSKFIKVKLSNGSELFYKLNADTKFESGKKYSYQINVKLTALTVTTSVNNWDAVNSVDGDAEME